ncbi:hypothetical protein [Lacrimispora celerecrescens]|uniref:hypothetical protein n=1 Tax=Lacrimispora celerecrescens TaxID=29354 RepID=UPI001649BA47|nr:hypothetical protein [Lacrimispora celerecrescens]
MASLNGFIKPRSGPKFLEPDKNISRGDGASLPEPSLTTQQKKNKDKFEKEMEKNTKY